MAFAVSVRLGFALQRALSCPKPAALLRMDALCLCRADADAVQHAVQEAVEANIGMPSLLLAIDALGEALKAVGRLDGEAGTNHQG